MLYHKIGVQNNWTTGFDISTPIGKNSSHRGWRKNENGIFVNAGMEIGKWQWLVLREKHDGNFVRWLGVCIKLQNLNFPIEICEQCLVLCTSRNTRFALSAMLGALHLAQYALCAQCNARCFALRNTRFALSSIRFALSSI